MQDQNAESKEVEEEPQEAEREVPVEEAEHSVPGVEHKPEPDAENIMPAKDQLGNSLMLKRSYLGRRVPGRK
jgi:hypothetical protein